MKTLEQCITEQRAYLSKNWPYVGKPEGEVFEDMVMSSAKNAHRHAEFMAKQRQDNREFANRTDGSNSRYGDLKGHVARLSHGGWVDEMEAGKRYMGCNADLRTR